MRNDKNIIFITGGVCSSLGKGVLSSSIASILELREIKVSMLKMDPYVNVDAGNISPYQHGEVYVTKDGFETDLDMGTYYRFSEQNLTKKNSVTTGQIYREVIKKEREGYYLGDTVQIIPHITDHIKTRIFNCFNYEKEQEVLIVEIGGTVGDIESLPFFEAQRQLIFESENYNVLSLHLTLIPNLISGEIKTKPSQNSIKTLRQLGIQADILACRSQNKLDESIKKKLSLFTNIKKDFVMSIPNLDTIYRLPLILQDQELDTKIIKLLDLDAKKELDNKRWQDIIFKFEKNNTKTVKILLIGKYTKEDDTYKSINEAIFHASLECNLNLVYDKIEASDFQENTDKEKLLDEYDGVIIPGGFGSRGSEAFIDAIKLIRTKKKTFLGICLGMQLMAVEYARNVLNLVESNSTEFDKNTKHPVIDLIKENKEYGGTMNLGEGDIYLKENTNIFDAYNSNLIQERHRHRYEIKKEYFSYFDSNDIKISAYSGDIKSDNFGEGLAVECLEWTTHWGVAVQFHPEFTSKPYKPSPLFLAFLKASGKQTTD